MTNEEAMKLLKPCPCCGNESPMLYGYGNYFVVHCGRYACNLEYAYIAATREECINAWNNLQKEVKQ